MKKIYIVTGANGFLGNNIVRRLIKAADKNTAEIRALVLPGDKIHSLDGVKCTIYQGDVTRKDSLSEIFSTPDDTELYVIHCAAVVYIKSKYNPVMYDVNVNGTKNVIDLTLEKNARLVYVSSVHAITELKKGETMTESDDFDPVTVEGQYAKNKAEMAKYFLEATAKRGLNAVMVHPSGIIGPGDYGSSHTTQLIVDFANGRLKACVKGGYDFVDVRDVADGIIKACEAGRAGECYILSNRFITVKELLDTISEVMETKKIKTVLPMWFAKMFAPLAEIYYAILRQPPLFTRYSLYTLCSNASFSSEKAKRELGYKTRDFTETIADTVDWLKEQGRIKTD